MQQPVKQSITYAGFRLRTPKEIVCVFSRFSRKKAKIDAQIEVLRMVEHSIKTELETYVSHLRTVQLSYDNIQKQTIKILALLKEKKQDG